MGNIFNGVMKFCKGGLIVPQAKKTYTIYLIHAQICLEEENMAADTVGEL